MKYLIGILTVLLFTCSNVKNSTFDKNKKEEINWCPNDGDCTVEKLSKKTIRFKTDKFGNSYTELLDGINNVLKFEYIRNKSADLEDDSYREVVWIEILKDEKKLTTTNLGKHNVIYERFCFCRGETGSYKVTEGELTLNKETNSNYIKLSFKNNKVPQVITFVETYF